MKSASGIVLRVAAKAAVGRSQIAKVVLSPEHDEFAWIDPARRDYLMMGPDFQVVGLLAEG